MLQATRSTPVHTLSLVLSVTDRSMASHLLGYWLLVIVVVVVVVVVG
jgi:hypothetical protein